MNKVVASRRRQKKNVVVGVAHVTSTFNNTIVTITDVQGNVIAWSTAGVMRFSGSKKSTTYAAQVASEDAANKAKIYGLKTVEVHVKGAGNGKEAAVRALHNAGLVITLIRDVTEIAHNGCRPRKQRRA